MPASIACNSGWLEQVACMVGTREHESLVVVEAKPSEVHAALLLLGLEPGTPGRWKWNGERMETTPPRGPRLEPIVRWRSAGGEEREARLADWIRGADGRRFPAAWVFSGSILAPNPRSLGPGEHYVADFSGSLVGLVTFGDETIGAVTIFADQTEVEAANWEAWTERMPAEGSPVTLVLRVAEPAIAPAPAAGGA